MRVIPTITVKLSSREAAMIVAALANWQMDSLNENLAEEFSDFFYDGKPLTDEEISSLCERLEAAEQTKGDSRDNA